LRLVHFERGTRHKTPHGVAASITSVQDFSNNTLSLAKAPKRHRSKTSSKFHLATKIFSTWKSHAVRQLVEYLIWSWLQAVHRSMSGRFAVCGRAHCSTLPTMWLSCPLWMRGCAQVSAR